MSSHFLDNLYGNLASTLFSLGTIAFSYLIVNLVVVRKLDSQRKKQNFRIRSFYVACVIFLFLMAHVWVNGFTHLLTVLGLVSAGLVVTNKEIIMNLVGWLVITWRGLFAEEDLIQIQQYMGYVKRIGILYITLNEVSDTDGNITGRVIRVPNGLTANNALINFSQPSHLLEQKFVLAVSPDNDFIRVKESVKKIVEDALLHLSDKDTGLSDDAFTSTEGFVFDRTRANVRVMLVPKTENLSLIDLVVKYYCSSQFAQIAREHILLSLMKSIESDGVIKLAK